MPYERETQVLSKDNLFSLTKGKATIYINLTKDVLLGLPDSEVESSFLKESYSEALQHKRLNSRESHIKLQSS